MKNQDFYEIVNSEICFFPFLPSTPDPGNFLSTSTAAASLQSVYDHTETMTNNQLLATLQAITVFSSFTGNIALVNIDQLIPIENHLEKHKIDFRVVINNSPDVHLPGENWLKAGRKATLYSYKLYDDSYTVKARIKLGLKEDIVKTIHNVNPGQDKVYVYYKDGHYRIKKKHITKEFYYNRMIPVENHLKKHKVDFRVVVDHGPDVHLIGDNWLKHGGKSFLVSHRLYRDNYTVKARVKIDGAKIDKHLSIGSVKPGQHKVYVYYKDGEYPITANVGWIHQQFDFFSFFFACFRLSKYMF